MEKELFVLKGLSGENYQSFRMRILEIARRLAEGESPQALKVTLTTRRPPILAVIPFKRKKIALFSVYGPTANIRDELSSMEGFAGGYFVTEAIPVAYKKDWENGTESPGLCLLTLFHRKPAIGQVQFISRWHGGHTPLSLEIHPLWNYNRNVVDKLSVEGSVWYDGIVEEQFRRASELLNPIIFFGPFGKVLRHMLMVLKDTRSFIDMKRMETYLASEYHIKS